MITAWTKNCKTEQEKELLTNSILGSKTALNRLNELLVEESNRLDRSEMDVKSFENPNWAYLQSYKNGFRAALAVTQKIINLDQGNK